VPPPAITPPPPKAAVARSVKEISAPKTPEIASPTLLAKGYDPTGKINPFEALFRKKTPTAVVVVPEEELKCPQITPLQKIALSQLKLTGVILAAGGNRALVEESSGKGYVLEKGTDIGPQCGTVVAIERDRVLVEEKVKDVRGKIVTQTRELKLQKPPGEI
jgi:type IV pilus assembly protein PilP